MSVAPTSSLEPRRNFFPVYKEVSSQSRSVYHWSSLDQDTHTDTHTL